MKTIVAILLLTFAHIGFDEHQALESDELTYKAYIEGRMEISKGLWSNAVATRKEEVKKNPNTY